MSTTTGPQDGQSVTVPLSSNLLQQILALQLMGQTKNVGQTQAAPKTQQYQQQAQPKPVVNNNQLKNTQPKPQSSQSKAENLQQNQTRPQNVQQKPQEFQSRTQNNQQMTATPNSDTIKKEQPNSQAQHPLLGSLLSQAGFGNQLNDQGNNQKSEAGNPGGFNIANQEENRPRNFKYSSTLSGNPQHQYQDRDRGGDFNNRNRPFQNRGPNNFQNNNNFGNRGYNNNRFQQKGDFQGRGRPFNNNGNNENEGEGRFQGRFQGRDQSDFSRSRSRDKSQNFRPKPFGGQQRNNNWQGGQDNRFRRNNEDNTQQEWTPKPRNQKKGDWECPDPNCKNINFSIRMQCNRCGIDKPQELMEQEQGQEQEQERKGNMPAFKKGDWNCANCKNMNFARRDVCNRCNAERPKDTYESFKPGRKNFSPNNEEEFGFSKNDYEAGEVTNNGDNDWMRNTDNFGSDGIEDGEVV